MDSSYWRWVRSCNKGKRPGHPLVCYEISFEWWQHYSGYRNIWRIRLWRCCSTEKLGLLPEQVLQGSFQRFSLIYCPTHAKGSRRFAFKSNCYQSPKFIYRCGRSKRTTLGLSGQSEGNLTTYRCPDHQVEQMHQRNTETSLLDVLQHDELCETCDATAVKG